jgi:hypothetical protein
MRTSVDTCQTVWWSTHLLLRWRFAPHRAAGLWGWWAWIQREERTLVLEVHPAEPPHEVPQEPQPHDALVGSLGRRMKSLQLAPDRAIVVHVVPLVHAVLAQHGRDGLGCDRRFVQVCGEVSTAALNATPVEREAHGTLYLVEQQYPKLCRMGRQGREFGGRAGLRRDRLLVRLHLLVRLAQPRTEPALERLQFLVALPLDAMSQRHPRRMHLIELIDDVVLDLVPSRGRHGIDAPLGRFFFAGHGPQGMYIYAPDKN